MIPGQGTWESTLRGRDLDGNAATIEAYYDTAQNITWLADANYARTTGYDADGKMTWATATAWAAGLNIGGVTGWRLPTTVDVGNDGVTYTSEYQGVDAGYNITTLSEMSRMFYVTLGDKAYYNTAGSGPQPGWGLTNAGPFSNVEVVDNAEYWSGTGYAPNAGYAWTFKFNTGLQNNHLKDALGPAWAVHSGDVGVSVVPVPAAVWLLGSGLAGLFGMTRARRRFSVDNSNPTFLRCCSLALHRRGLAALHGLGFRRLHFNPRRTPRALRQLALLVQFHRPPHVPGTR